VPVALVALIAHCTYNVHMTVLRFEWDPVKAGVNQKKHGVSFEEAQTVFADERARLIDDPDHSEDEDRFILLGLSSSLRVLVVVHCYRSEGNTVRIISARKATREEQRYYP
jgi:uncharacterized protein